MWKKVVSGLGFVAVLVAGGIGGLVGKSASREAFASFQPGQQEIEKALVEGMTKMADQANARGPVMLDEDTRLDKTVVGPGARATYFYTLVKYSSQTLASDTVLNLLKPVITKGVCSNKEMAPSLKYGVTYAYVYFGNDGVEIARFDVRKSNCDNQQL